MKQKKHLTDAWTRISGPNGPDCFAYNVYVNLLMHTNGDIRYYGMRRPYYARHLQFKNCCQFPLSNFLRTAMTACWVGWKYPNRLSRRSYPICWTMTMMYGLPEHNATHLNGDDAANDKRMSAILTPYNVDLDATLMDDEWDDLLGCAEIPQPPESPLCNFVYTDDEDDVAYDLQDQDTPPDIDWSSVPDMWDRCNSFKCSCEWIYACFHYNLISFFFFVLLGVRLCAAEPFAIDRGNIVETHNIIKTMMVGFKHDTFLKTLCVS